MKVAELGGSTTIVSDWPTGEPAVQYVVGDSRFYTLGAADTLDDDGRLLYGKTRLLQ